MLNGSNNGHNRNGVPQDTTMVARNDSGAHTTPAVIDERELGWDGLPPAVTNALEQPIDPALVSRRKGRAGRTFSYIEGHTAISEANRVFGFGGWGFELVENVSLRRIETIDHSTGEIKVINAYTAPVRFTVPGAPPRTDVGFHAVTDETADGHETAIKGAVTDGLKRALRSFGDRFGNGLYGDQAQPSASPNPERVPAKATPSTGSMSNGGESQAVRLRKRLIEIAVRQGFDEDAVRTAVETRTGRSLDDLAAEELAPLVEAAANKLKQMQEAKGPLPAGQGGA